jgi:hypothetical protein
MEPGGWMYTQALGRVCWLKVTLAADWNIAANAMAIN